MRRRRCPDGAEIEPSGPRGSLDSRRDSLRDRRFAVVKDDVRQLEVKRMMRELNLNEQGSVEHFSLAVDALKRAYKIPRP